MTNLNLPPINCKITEIEGKNQIFDIIRKKNIVLTPEEWVRQHVVHLLIHQLGFSKSLIKVEGGLSYHGMAKRSDIVVFDQQAKPYLLIECKAPEVKLDRKTISQASIYNKTLDAPFVAISNGLKTYCFEMGVNGASSVQMKGFPEPPTAVKQ
ncbi:type I restriction enzyme HsdR N-terminal domain-containing protein [Arcticibacterium luteifluviistationis]|uniref:Restriction endonuclease subunit R n=1 Tax=Arcticibacterium luteifluviistationis TaxID=1784714 RepID=A0A2Z4GII9_9BACT|nr:type I restriction enzyme HsdR N-terminal domain-containing protein [Arcticibacterium luteifluviistationis]AWW00836.1 restriction endonuclease subunit R [Arcticibacterium luteifluviistationis]